MEMLRLIFVPSSLFHQITKFAFRPDKPQPKGHVARGEPVTADAEIPDGGWRANRRESVDVLFTAPAAFSKPR